MNLHPILVHFPIALLTFYALFELVRVQKLLKEPAWFYVKAAFVIVGSLSSVATLLSGLAIKPQFQGSLSIAHQVDVHSAFAFYASLLFGLIAFAYLVRLVKWKACVAFSDFMLKSRIIVPLALIGLVLITITGALGGSIVYGPDIDPFVKFVYQTLIKK